MTLSVTQPISRAIEHTKRVLFKPFDIGKWFVLGFAAFLARLGESGPWSSFHTRFPGRAGGDSAGRSFAEIADNAIAFVTQHLGLILAIGAVVMVVMLALGVVLIWLSSRGRFIFLDGVVRNRAAIVEPWTRFRALGNSLFLARCVIALLALLVFALIGVGSAAVAWPDIVNREFGPHALSAVILFVSCLLLSAVVFGLLKGLIEDFVTAVMYRYNLSFLAAASMFWSQMLRSHIGAFILFYLMKLLLMLAMGMMIGVIWVITCCVACCLMAIPYIGTVLLLPILVFVRSYSIMFMEQFGPAWRFIEAPRSEAPAPLE